MLKLLQNELLKILFRKSTYIVLIIVAGFIILNNVIYKNSNTKTLKEETSIEELQEEIELFESSNNFGVDYIRNLAQIELAKYQKKYTETWQTYIIQNNIKNSIDSNIFEGNINTKHDLLEALNEYEKKLMSNEWKWFLNIEIQTYDLMLNDKSLTDEEKEIINLKKNWTRYRLKNEINYDDSSSDIAIKKNIESNIALISPQNSLNEYERQELKKEVTISEFVVSHNIDYYNKNNSNTYLLDIFYDYQIFIVIILLVLCGTIISSEASEKTIKNLLIKPYTRSKILLSKYITSIIILLFCISYVFTIQYIVGNVMFGHTSLFEEIGIIYNYNTQAVSLISNISYLFIELIQFLPFFLIIITLFMMVGVLTFNNTLSIFIPLFLIIFSNTINTLIVKHGIKFMKYFLTLNWDLTELFFGKIPQYSYVTLKSSIFVCFVYILIFVVLSFISFNRKDIKNI